MGPRALRGLEACIREEFDPVLLDHIVSLKFARTPPLDVIPECNGVAILATAGGKELRLSRRALYVIGRFVVRDRVIHSYLGAASEDFHRALVSAEAPENRFEFDSTDCVRASRDRLIDAVVAARPPGSGSLFHCGPLLVSTGCQGDMSPLVQEDREDAYQLRAASYFVYGPAGYYAPRYRDGKCGVDYPIQLVSSFDDAAQARG